MNVMVFTCQMILRGWYSCFCLHYYIIHDICIAELFLLLKTQCIYGVSTKSSIKGMWIIMGLTLFCQIYVVTVGKSLHLFSNEELNMQLHVPVYFYWCANNYCAISGACDLIRCVTFFSLPKRSLFKYPWFSNALLFYFPLLLNISRHRNTNMKPWTRGTIAQKA